MSRYRPPAPPKSPYISRAGYDRLALELDGLWLRRHEVTAALAAAAAEGDRSENAEYIYRKKELRELDRRIRYLQKRLPELKVVSEPPSRQDRVFFGAWLTLEDELGSLLDCRILGSDEIDPANNWMSLDAPLAQALLGRGLDDEIQLSTPAGQKTYLIVAISYQAPKPIDA
ncbi:transcription elongation factor GreB [Magnetovirga frankeli]|uniref:transcription elongation factor GreB n=1 Tax=Magnetovirga frankeli TaxID=947516 RepID=UPI001293D56E|nr:transcription elongation factor GreB [gamma proteobacterium SS-5]